MKKIVLVICSLFFINSLQAQLPPSISNDWRGSGNTTNDQAFLDGLLIRSRRPSTQSRESVNPPLAPATLLLLGLGGATVGGAVYRNSKRKK
ncbi:MAG: PEP-CTERM sorting domain-containing protein [Bacteroidales bacterium]|nr:PEP-CTERM sorting domain-containing protein [Bacteroidales bacterium]